ncbi:MAG: glucoamylase family protein [Bacteroidota bacterium]|nr:glucoamylase family protein [Bacteroidota bacterium]
MKKIFILTLTIFTFLSCKKEKASNPAPGTNPFNLVKATANDSPSTNKTLYNLAVNPVIKFSFSAPINKSTAAGNIGFVSGNTVVANNYSFSNGDSSLIIQPTTALNHLTNYTVSVVGIKSVADSALKTVAKLSFVTSLDSTDKFPQISDSALLTLVQQQTFKYFYDFGHPVSGLARERNSSADVVTTGGSGFGVMAILVGIQRNFISHAEGLARINLIVNFLISKAQRYHGAFPHWMNGATGATIPFTAQDDGADLVETSYMIEGLLCARQFFNSTTDPDEISLRTNINSIYNGVEWNWFRQNGQNVLYWHWSPDFNFAIGQQISGWDEAMIVYALAASSAIDSNRIPKIVYDNGWAQNGGMKNGVAYYGIVLPLGPVEGGPLFFAHYSFLGIDPHNLSDAYANYWTQDTAHTMINYSYCVANPDHFNGYSNLCWGLSASDDNASGYSAHSPTNDIGVISPTAAISSLPYTPTQSMNALKFFYYKLGDKIWGQYGFADAFNLSNLWFANSYLAIDQGPEIIMIENYRSGLLWNLFMSCPEIKTGMKNLGFQSPQLN